MSQRGFTLLEVIVALVILSTAGMAIFSWIESNLEAVARIKAVNEESAAKEDAIDFMQTVNPMLRPAGLQKLGHYAVRWKAEPASEMMDNRNKVGIGIYKVALYKTHIELLHREGAHWFTFDLKQVGYKQVREPSKGGFGI